MSTSPTTSTRSAAAPPRPFDTVVVVGGSVAGLLAAAAASPHAASVLLLERDTLPDGPAARPGTPQVDHAHGLLASGRGAIEQLLPGFTADLISGGAVTKDDFGRSGRWWLGGGLIADCTLGIDSVAASRQLVESTLRDRVRRLPRVAVREGVDVCGLLAEGGRVRGVRLRHRGTPEPREEILAADLVIDATGRSGRAGGWFRELGWQPPREERVRIGVRYATTHVERRPDDLEGRLVTVSGPVAAVPRGAVAIAQEGDGWVVTLFGYAEDQPPLDEDGFRAYAATVVSPDVAALLAERPLLHAPRGYRFPDGRRRYVEELATLPPGFAAIGDAICSFNPAFGQGMSVAALESVALADELARGPEAVRTTYPARAGAVVDRAWALVIGADSRIPGVEGARPRGPRWIGSYVRRLQRVARDDPAVAAAFFRVTNLIDSPARLLRPAIAARVLGHGTTRGLPGSGGRTAGLPGEPAVPR